MFERSAELYDLVYGYKDYAGEARRVDELTASAGPTPLAPRPRLRHGQHLAALADRYPDVAGLDLDEGLLAVARDRLPDVPLHLGDMTSFDLGRRFDAVTCLFSAIGYVRTAAKLDAAIEAMAAPPGARRRAARRAVARAAGRRPGHLHLLTVDEPDVKIARASVAGQERDGSILELHYLVVTRAGVEHFTEHHEVGLFTRAQHARAFETAGLDVVRDEEGRAAAGSRRRRVRPARRPASRARTRASGRRSRPSGCRARARRRGRRRATARGAGARRSRARFQATKASMPSSPSSTPSSV